jgi:hypothetical protein
MEIQLKANPAQSKKLKAESNCPLPFVFRFGLSTLGFCLSAYAFSS